MKMLGECCLTGTKQEPAGPESWKLDPWFCLIAMHTSRSLDPSMLPRLVILGRALAPGKDSRSLPRV